MASKVGSKLVDISKFFRRFYYKSKEIILYRALAARKNVLIIGGDGQVRKEEIIKNFSDSWRVINLSSREYKDCDNILVEEAVLGSTQKYQSICERLTNISKIYDCIICLQPDFIEIDQSSRFSIKEEAIFQDFESQINKNLQPQILAAHLACKILASNGILILNSLESTYFGKQDQKRSNILSQNINDQSSMINLIIGDRDETYGGIHIDAYSINLLNPDTLPDQELTKINKEIVKTTRVWAEGKFRPYPGSFIQFQIDSKTNKVVPKYL